ncbi:hypothetical protein FBZ87_106175 [Nitrospirillum amazonense]|uniref:Uncharacterized protein n=1 Tax=Nitrospirillum amazonense TaxID=28077 RepID=A0A560JL73_9PROT|nr:hypothetical protein FBZ87_106175 [Nitrospirillum amazonense]
MMTDLLPANSQAPLFGRVFRPDGAGSSVVAAPR